MRIVFHIEYRTVWGESLYLTGDAAELGAGDESRALKMHHAGDGIWTAAVDLPEGVAISYRYLLRSYDRTRREWGAPHTLTVGQGLRLCRVYDRWSEMPADKSFYSSAFTDGIFARRQPVRPAALPTAGSIQLRAAAPSLRPDEVLAVAGEGPALGDWDPAKAPLMSDAGFPEWSLTLDAARLPHPCAYKFVILKADTRAVVAWEHGENRQLEIPAPGRGECAVVAGLRLNNPAQPWKGAGVVIPVFSLRTEQSFGVGEFYDLKPMVDWAVRTGLKVIQLLPINDTTMSHTWQDSYPYNANSTFALHPQFLHLEAVGRLADPKRRADHEALARELNALPEVDYERVNAAKRAYLREIFEAEGEKTLATAAYKRFFEENRRWLEPYAAFCTLRDRFGTPDFHCWKEYARYDEALVKRLSAPRSKLRSEVRFNYFLQYHLHTQLVEVRNYAHARGVVLKGDIPIGISRTSVDAWLNPSLFRMNSQAGAPPDDFSVLGQNWGFPTYNWEEMARDGYAWWKARFRKMAEYFDAYRIDHILGFFRIWEIPEEAVHGLLGHFNPALPFTRDELRSYGFDLREEHLRPFICDRMLDELFGDAADEVRSRYLRPTGGGRYALVSEAATQRRIAELFAGRDDERSRRIADGLMGLLDEVLFVEDPVKRGCCHPRISGRSSYAYRALSDGERAAFDRLYNDFYYHRQNDFWYAEAMKKLPPLLDATRMLVCGEDLGMIPDCVPAVMHGEQILSLEIQRMPKDPAVEFADTQRYPYLSVCASSTHDMSTIRGWWEEDREKSRRFYNRVLHEAGEAPQFCEPWVCERILEMHVQSPAMLALLPLSDWLSMDGALRRENPAEERINVPAIPRYYWRYRMHLKIEQLLAADASNDRMRQMIARSGR